MNMKTTQHDPLEHAKQRETTLQQQERRNRPARFVPRNYRAHANQRAAEHERLEQELDVPFEDADRLDAVAGVDVIQTDQGGAR